MRESSTRYRDGYDDVVADGLSSACLVVAGAFLLFVVWHPLSLIGTAAPVMTGVAAATSAFMAGMWLYLRRRRVPAGKAHVLGGVLALVVYANCVVQYALTEQAYLSVNVTLILVGTGVTLVDPRWVAGLIAAMTATWLVHVTVVTSLAAALGGLSALVLGAIVAGLGNVVRVGTLRRLLDTQAELRALSQRDDLTGLLNRRGFLEAAERRIERGRPVRLWFVDVDDLKGVNDEHGHDVGDVLLVSVATALEDVFAGEVVARLSGDEFAVVEDHGSPAGLEQAEQALAARLAVASRATGLPVSVTSGSAVAQPGQTLSEVLSAADAAMYARKRRTIRLPRERAPEAPLDTRATGTD